MTLDSTGTGPFPRHFDNLWPTTPNSHLVSGHQLLSCKGRQSFITRREWTSTTSMVTGCSVTHRCSYRPERTWGPVVWLVTPFRPGWYLLSLARSSPDVLGRHKVVPLGLFMPVLTCNFYDLVSPRFTSTYSVLNRYTLLRWFYLCSTSWDSSGSLLIRLQNDATENLRSDFFLSMLYFKDSSLPCSSLVFRIPSCSVGVLTCIIFSSLLTEVVCTTCRDRRYLVDTRRPRTEEADGTED